MPSQKQDIIDAFYYDEDIPAEEKEKFIEGFFRTRDKNIAAYLKARGFKFRGMEKVRLGNGSKKQLVVFCFDGQGLTRRSLLEYYTFLVIINYTLKVKLMM